MVVYAEDDHLRVSNLDADVRIPYEDVERIREGNWDNAGTVTLYLSKPCDFGRKITFVRQSDRLIESLRYRVEVARHRARRP